VIKQLKPLVERISDPQLKQDVLFYLRHAHLEFIEGDEDECAMFVVQAARLMGCRQC
jgi:hypothetical protein